MKVFLVKFAVLLAMMSFIFCTGDSVSPAAPEESGSTESPKEPLFCSVPLDDQEKIFDCIKREISEPNSEFAKKLSNYTMLFCENIKNFTTIACNQTDEVRVNMTGQEKKSMFELALKCEAMLKVTLPPAC
uniref:Putative salivary secreted peptide n=1 Tax=Ixodes ricinus TaxID=34613 RepID=A0A6B0UQU9_IXORI